MDFFCRVEVLALCITSVAWFWIRLDLGTRRWVSPDGFIYLQAAGGRSPPRPYQRRWLLPLVLGNHRWRWEVSSGFALVVMGPLLAAYVPGETWQRLAAVGLFVGCSGVFRMNVAHAVLVDAPALAFSLASAISLETSPLLSVGFALLSGGCHERGPVFAAIFSANPLPLIGLLGVGWWRKAAPATEPWLRNPVAYALKHHAGHWLSWREMLLPWGALVVLFPLGVSLDRATLIALLALAIAYGQLLMATDRARLYQWAAPAVIVVAIRALPEAAAPLVLLLHFFNPSRPERFDLDSEHD